MRRRLKSRIAVAALACMVLAPHAAAQEKPMGITRPARLPPFEAGLTTCQPPPGLQKSLAFAQDNRRQFMEGVSFGLMEAAKSRSLAYEVLLADNDAGRMIEQVAALSIAKVGAVVAAPVDPASLAPKLQEMIWNGAYVGTVVPPPATTLLNAPQYLTGKVLADAAVEHIRINLKGKARVVLLTHDSLQFLAPRFSAMRDAFKDLPGVVIVADISPFTVDQAGGSAIMRTILLANPDVDVVLGADTVVLGALDAVRGAGKARNDQFFGGIDGEPGAIAEIKSGGPYKATVSLASPVFGYALGSYAADWLEGKYVPQAMDILPKAITVANVAGYEADLANPGVVFADKVKRDSYLKMYGRICYDTRDQYINFPWSSER